jgi:hypothetical protein
VFGWDAEDLGEPVAYVDEVQRRPAVFEPGDRGRRVATAGAELALGPACGVPGEADDGAGFVPFECAPSSPTLSDCRAELSQVGAPIQIIRGSIVQLKKELFDPLHRAQRVRNGLPARDGGRVL